MPRADMYRKLTKPDTELLRSILDKKPTSDDSRESSKRGIQDSMWFGSYSQNKFRVKVNDAQNIVSGKLFGIGVKAGVFLGDVMVCPEEKTRYIPPTDHPEWYV